MSARLPAYLRNPKGDPQVRRWSEQRWLIDNVIRANGIDWDQPLNQRKRECYENSARLSSERWYVDNAGTVHKTPY